MFGLKNTKKQQKTLSAKSATVLIDVIDGGCSEWIMNFLSGKCELDSCPSFVKSSLENVWANAELK